MDIAWFLLLAPLAATVAILLHLHRKPNEAMFASVGSASLCFAIAIAVACGGIKEPTPWTWISIPGMHGGVGLDIQIGMIFDSLSKGMLLIVTGVGLLVHIFSIGYMAHDPSKGRFFGGLSIFMFSMTGIVLATNLIELFIFWEGVGVSSYLLVGFWYQKNSAADAANKAFVCNRLADFGFVLGILAYWLMSGTVSIEPAALAQSYHSQYLPAVQSILSQTELALHHGSAIFSRAPGSLPTSPVFLTLMVLGLFCGCVGKSAMVPFHVWLPDAMEGPTPVSALIHAATMVAAGVYMLCRVYPLPDAFSHAHTCSSSPASAASLRRFCRPHRRPSKTTSSASSPTPPCRSLATRSRPVAAPPPMPPCSTSPLTPSSKPSTSLPPRLPSFTRSTKSRTSGKWADSSTKSRSPSGRSPSAPWRSLVALSSPDRSARTTFLPSLISEIPAFTGSVSLPRASPRFTCLVWSSLPSSARPAPTPPSIRMNRRRS